MTEARIDDLSFDECLDFLRGGSIGRIAVVVSEFPVVVPINYRLVETNGRTWVALRTRPGNVIDQASMKAAFEIDQIDAAHHEGWSVLARGTLHHVDPDVADFRERFDPHPWLMAERDAWLVLEPFSITGRRVRGETPEWAFQGPAYL